MGKGKPLETFFFELLTMWTQWVILNIPLGAGETPQTVTRNRKGPTP